MIEKIIIIAGGVLVYLVLKKITEVKVDTIDAKKLSEMLKDKSIKRQYIDVRTPYEFSDRKIKGFKNIPIKIFHKRIGEIKDTMPTVLICATGSRSIRAARILKKSGYNNIINVKGGLIHYK